MTDSIVSFFKIRLLIIIIGVLVVENVFAAWPGECTVILEKWLYVTTLSPDTGLKDWTFNSADGTFGPNSFGQYTTYVSCYTRKSYYWENNQWNLQAVGNSCNGMRVDTPPPHYAGSVRSLPPDGCSPCSDKKIILETECGGPDKYFIDDETCEGHCLPDEDCTEEYNAKIVECGSVEKIIKWNNETCEGLCFYIRQNAGPPDEDECKK